MWSTAPSRSVSAKAVSILNILNRIVRLSEAGYDFEAGSRHAALVIKQLVDERTHDVSSPGTDLSDQRRITAARRSSIRRKPRGTQGVQWDACD